MAGLSVSGNLIGDSLRDTLGLSVGKRVGKVGGFCFGNDTLGFGVVYSIEGVGAMVVGNLVGCGVFKGGEVVWKAEGLGVGLLGVEALIGACDGLLVEIPAVGSEGRFFGVEGALVGTELVVSVGVYGAMATISML